MYTIITSYIKKVYSFWLIFDYSHFCGSKLDNSLIGQLIEQSINADILVSFEHNTVCSQRSGRAVQHSSSSFDVVEGMHILNKQPCGSKLTALLLYYVGELPSNICLVSITYGLDFFESTVSNFR